MLPDEPKALQSELATDSSIGNSLAKETVTPSLSSTPTRPVPDGAHSPSEILDFQLAAPEESPRTNRDLGLEADSLPAVGIVPQTPSPDPPQSAISKPAVQFLQLPSEKVAVEIHTPPNPTGFWRLVWKVSCDFARDFGALLTGLASVAVTVVIAILAQQISQQQTKISQQQTKSMEEQAKATQEGVRLDFIKEFRERLGELIDNDQNNRTRRNLAAIALAQYGEGALPALKMSLAASDDQVQKGAALVVIQMLSEKSLRGLVLNKLREYFDENNAFLRVGVLECYIMLNRGLDEPELREAKSSIRKYIDPSANYSGKPQEQRVLLGTAKFYSNWPSRDSVAFLLAVARNRTCDDASVEQAINYLPSVTNGAADVTAEEHEALRKEVSAGLRALMPELPAFKMNIEDGISKLEGR
jgi:hypothetical protein